MSLDAQTKKMRWFLASILILILFLPKQIQGKTKCVTAVGKLKCAPQPEKVAFVQITMMDHDALPWEQDDTMGKAISNEDGSFEVSGCGYDFGPWNTPDPYLKISHQCHVTRENAWKDTKVSFRHIWFPQVSDVGTIEL